MKGPTMSDPKNPMTVIIDRETYEILIDNYYKEGLRREAENYQARILTPEQLENLPK